MSSPAKVLITGAHGLIGNTLYRRLLAQPELYEPYGSARSAIPSRQRALDFLEIPPDKLRVAELSDADAVRRAVDGMDIVVHLGADASGKSWQSVLDNNIRATQHIYEASAASGVQRVIFASTNQTVFGYRLFEPYKALFEGRYDDLPDDYRPITVDMPPRTLNEYAASKVWGEQMGQMYAYTRNLNVIALRIGWVLPDDRPPQTYRLNGRILWCSQRDCNQLIERSMQAPPELKYDIFFVQSNNRYNLVDIQHPQDVLGYAPQDSAEDYL